MKKKIVLLSALLGLLMGGMIQASTTQAHAGTDNLLAHPTDNLVLSPTDGLVASPTDNLVASPTDNIGTNPSSLLTQLLGFFSANIF